MTARSLEEQLAAAHKTIAALTRRVEQSVATGSSAFAALEQGGVLERVVWQKTRELEAKRGELERALAELRQTQMELLQAQKLESVGRLAAGIAHEINTPVQFVSDSVEFVRDAARDLFALLDRYAELRRLLSSGQATAAAATALEEAEYECDLDYLRQNVPAALERSVEGLDRVATLVRSMKEFAHPEQREKAPADLNRALTTTLTISRNEYKYVADVVTDLGTIPPVPCLLGELNQVFLNLVVNAAQAIEEAHRPRGTRGTIRISTRLEGDRVVVAVTDDGTGIPAEIRDRIFDPFFTTKEVGKGTGQGLSIARSVVVEKHGGELTFETTPGQGTTFFVRLPVQLQEVVA